MSDASSAGGSGIVAGWYTDPYDPQQLRWWDGAAWTGHVAPPAAPAPAAEVPAVETPAAEQAPVAEEVPAVEEAPAVEQTPAAEPQVFTSRRAMREASGESLATPTQSIEPVDVPELEPAPIEFPSYETPVTAAPVSTEPAAAEPAYAEPASPGAEAQPAQELTEEPAPVSAASVSSEPVQPLWSQPAVDPGVGPVADPGPVDTPFAEPGFTRASFGTPTFTPEPTTPESAPPAASAPEHIVASEQSPVAVESPFVAAPSNYSPPPTEPEIIDVLPAYDAAPQEASPFPAAATEGRTSGLGAAPGNAFTVWVWLIVISPLLAAGIVGYVLATFTITGSPLILGASILAPYLFVILFAAGDRSRLLAAGHDRPASFGWAALSAPIYLVMRAGRLREEGSSGNLVLLLWLIAFVLAIAGMVGYGALVGPALLPGLPSKV